MDNQNDLVIYKNSEITLPSIPKRSFLFQIPPILSGSDYVESLTGYINRIGLEHCVAPKQIIRFCLINSKRKLETNISFTRSLNGINNGAKLAAEVLVEATFLREIKYTNLSNLQNVISNDHLLKTQKYWCPYCLNDDKKNLSKVYERLIWNLDIVEICSIHEVNLSNRCSDCGNAGTLTLYPYGFCLYCKNWLGKSLDQKSKAKNEILTSKKIWCEKQARNIVRLIPFSHKLFNEKQILNTLFQIVMCQFEGNISRFCRKTGLTEVDIIRLFSGETLISLRKLVSICYTLNLDIISLMSGKLFESSSKEYKLDNLEELSSLSSFSDMYIENNFRSIKKISKKELNRISVIMKKLILKEPMPFSKVCKIVEINERVLKRIHPYLSLILISKYRNSK